MPIPFVSTELVPINRESGKPSVNARDLHTFLEVGKDFSTWIKDRIQQFDFVEGQDFEKSEILRSPVSGSAKADGMSISSWIERAIRKDLEIVPSAHRLMIGFVLLEQTRFYIGVLFVAAAFRHLRPADLQQVRLGCFSRFREEPQCAGIPAHRFRPPQIC